MYRREHFNIFDKKFMLRFTMFASRIGTVALLLLISLSGYSRVDAKKCRAHRWKCNDGTCIYKNLLCDGKIDCPDGSDETVSNCFRRECPEDTFNCSYGGCIKLDKKCDGRQNCADFSDETALLCGDDKAKNDFFSNVQGLCREYDVHCKETNECIDRFDTCDGIKNCPDGSDETIDLCFTNTCPHYSFKCSYGACISGNAMCNGTIECWDRSDETPNICDRFKETTKTSVVPPTTEQSTTPAKIKSKPTLVNRKKIENPVKTNYSDSPRRPPIATSTVKIETPSDPQLKERKCSGPFLKTMFVCPIKLFRKWWCSKEWTGKCK